MTSANDFDEPFARLFDAIPRGWVVGRAPSAADTGTCRLYAFERRPRSNTISSIEVEARSESEAVAKMTRLLREAAGRG